MKIWETSAFEELSFAFAKGSAISLAETRFILI